MVAEQFITEQIDLWTAAIKRRSTAGRGSSKKIELYGTKKLRELILELAVRGLLVPQDSKDEPASELLKRIAAEKAKLSGVGKGNREFAFPAVTDEEMPFTLPAGWACERVGNLVSKLGSGSTPRGGKEVYVNEGIRFLRSQNVWNEGIDLEDIAFISLETHEKMGGTKVIPGDVLLNITGASLGRSAIFPGELIEANVSQHVTIIRLLLPEMVRFVHLGVISPMVQKLVWGRQVGMAIEGLSKKVLEMFEFPIPPLAEQHRIVAKVDELMVLCDQLEQQTDASLSAHQTLVENLLNALTSAADQAQFASSWQRIAEHFDTLFTTEESITQLKQTILQLAVMGKVVSQDPNDEPASELLKRIAAEKAKLVKEGKIRKKAPLSPIGDEEKPFELPNGWEWVRLGDTGIGSTGKTPSTKESKYFEGDIPFIGPGQISPHGELLEPEKYLSEAGLEESTEAIENDILMVCIGGSIGKAVIADRRLAFNQQLNLIRPIGVLAKYLYLAVSTDAFYKDVLKQASGSATPIINRSKWEELILPLCPEAEQYRIVAKVDELVALCDCLKNSLAAAQLTQVAMVDAIQVKGTKS